MKDEFTTQQHVQGDGNMYLQYDGDEVYKMAIRLQDMHRAALPNAVRFTLNDAAFDVKKRTLQEEAQSSFINRRPNFFKRFSGVEKATGYSIKQMESSVGMIRDPGVQATEDIAVQETGGKLPRAQIMLPGSRVSKSEKKPVASRYKAIGGFRDRTAARNKKEFVKAAFAAEKKKKPDHMRYVSESGKGYMIEVTKVTKLKNRLKIKSKIVASFNDDRQLHINPTPFVEKSSLKSANQLVNLFKKNAVKQLRRYAK